MLDITGRVVAITGASSGVGEATAATLVEAGARVVAGARRAEPLAVLQQRLGSNMRSMPMDVRRPQDSERLVRLALESFGRLDALVASAGVAVFGGIMDQTDHEIQEMLDTNIGGTVWPIRAATPHLKEAGRGDIVIVSSASGLKVQRDDESIYAATKHAQIGLAAGLDREFFPHGIRVTTICPGGIATDFGRGRKGLAVTSMTPSDVAEAIIWVLSRPQHLAVPNYSLRGLKEGH